jgi:cytochrome c2
MWHAARISTGSGVLAVTATTAASTGPSLIGLIGRRAGTVDGTRYARNLYDANIVWDEKSLDKYLASPSQEVHGTIMPIGLHDAAERRNVVSYLKTLR